MKKIIFSFLLFFVLASATFLFVPAETNAQDGLVPCGGEGQDECNFCHIFALAYNLVRFVLVPDANLNNGIAIVPLLATILLAIGGFFFLTSAGSGPRLEKAKQIITATIVGVFIIYGAWIFVSLLLDTFGFAQNWQINCSFSSPANSSPVSKYTAFVTSGVYVGDFGGTAFADSRCNALAQAAGLSETYTAWVSAGPSNEPRDRGLAAQAVLGLESAGWYLPDGTTKIADNWVDLTNGNIHNLINQNESGALVTAYSTWTGTDEFGAAISSNCGNWASSAASGICGEQRVDSHWTNSGSPCACATDRRFYCFQSS